ncbi:MAG: hypothetical protein WC378_15640 [Opitutaceae bacterium]|jgi:hypothetical protein
MTPTTKVIIGGEEYELLVSSGLAAYNASRCPRVMGNKRKAIATVFDSLWLYMLDNPFDSPSHLAAVCQTSEIKPAIEALKKCLDLGGASEKNSSASTLGPSPE